MERIVEEFPKFMTGVKEVLQLDVEQVPDQRIAWRSTSGDAGGWRGQV